MTLSTPRENRVSPIEYKSLGLHTLLDRVRDNRTYSVLDLGPALEANVRFWSQFSCSLHIHDFYRGFREWKAAVVPDEGAEERTFSARLAFSDEEVFDLILAWDLFNYFDLQELEAFVQRLSRWCRRETRLFALISSLPRIPASPMMFRILNCEQMTCEISTQATRPCPGHLPRDITRIMGRFKVSRSFLARHGIQEYVFVFE